MRVENINPYAGDKRSKREQVAAMFDAIAPRYDLMNHAMALGFDRTWLRALVKAASKGEPSRVVDLATGTGDVARALAHALPGATVLGIDISEGMLAKARAAADASPDGARMSFVCADCLATGLPDASTDAITAAYGVRNFADIEAGYREMYRILRPGGTLAVLELSEPVNALMKPFYKLYTKAVIPLVGRLVSGDASAYSYLPESIAACPSGDTMTDIMRRAGFKNAAFRRLFPGVCTLYTASKN